MLDVGILGDLEVTSDGARVDLGIRQARGLFSLLALNVGSPVRGAVLAEALWPDGPPPRWEATVQSHVSRLRKALDPDRAPRSRSSVLRTSGEAYVLDLPADAVDACRFERLASEGHAAMVASEPRRAAALFAGALKQWRGEPLADFPNPEAVRAEVTRLRELHAMTREDCADVLLAAGEHRSAVADLEQLVFEHPFRERAWELLILALYRSGRQAEAVRRHREVRTLLAEELGIEPGPALRALEMDILNQDPALSAVPDDVLIADAASSPVELSPPAWLKTPGDVFVGRVGQRRQMLEALCRCGEGDCERLLLLVTGDPGIGKTRLVREVVADMSQQGAFVVGGRCVEAALHALEPFAEAVERLAVLHADQLAAEAPGELAVLGGLLPELADGPAPFASLDAETQRYLMFRAVSSLLDRRRLGRPTVLVLEDLHWAAPLALQLLAHLMRDVERGPLLVLATTRATEPNDYLSATLADLRRDRCCELVPLKGLEPEKVVELAEARGNSSPGPRLYELTEGNPFYIEEYVRHLAHGGGLSMTSLPESVRDAIAQRLLRLPDRTRRLLDVAAVAGRAFRLDVVALAAGIDLDDAEDAVASVTWSAGTAGVLTESAASPGEYSFTHALIPAVLRDGLGPSRRARVERGYGEALAELGGPRGEVARHLLAGSRDDGEVVRGVEVAMEAAAEAEVQYRYHDAADVLDVAWSALVARAEVSAELACEVGIALAKACRQSGEYERRAMVLEDTWVRAERADVVDLMAAVIVEGFLGAVVPPEPWPTRAETTARLLDDSSDRKVVLTALLCHFHSGRSGDDARALAEWSMARTSRLSSSDRREVTECCLPVIAASSPIERIVGLARVSLAEARASGEVLEVIQGLSVMRRTALAAADVSGAEVAAREYEALVSSVRIPRFMAGVEQRRAMMALMQGRFGEAEAHAADAVALMPHPEFMEGLAVQLFAMRLEQGRLEEVRGAVEDWASQGTRAAWAIGLALLQAELGETESARLTLGPLMVDRFESVPHDDLYFLSLAVAGRTVALLEEVESARVLLDLLTPHASRVVVAAEGALCWGSIHRILGPLNALIGATDLAAVHFEAAISIHERMGALPFLARDRLAYADLLRRGDGDLARIEELERTGLALADRMGMAW